MINNYLAMAVAGLVVGCARAPEEHRASYQGIIEFDETTLAFETPGRVRRLLVDEGDRVTAGMLIAELDDDLIRTTRSARLLEAEAARSQSELVSASARSEDVAALAARVRAARATEDLLAKNVAREQELYAKSAVPLASLDELSAQLERARAERESLEAQLGSLKRGARREERDTASARAQAAEVALTLEGDRLLRYSLHAPVAGRVLERSIELGEVVASGTPVVVTGDTFRPYAEVFVPQAELGKVHQGDRCQVRIDAERQPFSAVVEHVSRRTEFTPRYLFSERERPNLVVRVRVRIDDAKERLHAGVPAFVDFEEGAKARTP
jgi:HlyD family secretion protein